MLWGRMVSSSIISAIVMFVLYVGLIKLLWYYVIPAIFPRAVEEGYITRSLSWPTAIMLAVLLGILN